jgi:hypothetical protein
MLCLEIREAAGPPSLSAPPTPVSPLGGKAAENKQLIVHRQLNKALNTP